MYDIGFFLSLLLLVIFLVLFHLISMTKSRQKNLTADTSSLQVILKHETQMALLYLMPFS